VPLAAYVAEDLRLWQQKRSTVNDWMFASPRPKGAHPFWPASLIAKAIRPAPVRAGIQKKIGPHTFRHTFSTMLIANGENVKVVQELMRHASSRCNHLQETDKVEPKIIWREIGVATADLL
jgi:integrase